MVPRGKIIWFTGLSGSGKSTIANEVKRQLEKKENLVILDGDELRKGLCSGLGYSLEDREENIRRIAEVAKIFSLNGTTTLVCTISPTEKIREIAKKILGNDMHLVWLSTPLKTCIERDVKGLYKNQPSNMTGTKQVFEEPVSYEKVLDTSKIPLEKCVDEVCSLVLKGGEYIKYMKFNGLRECWFQSGIGKFAWLVVNKCASKTIKNYIWTHDLKQKSIPAEVGFNGIIQSLLKSGARVSENNINKNYVKFTVYRDPVERFYAYLREYNVPAKAAVWLMKNYTFNDGVCIDEHLRRQTDTYTPDKVDYIVKLHDLDKFFEQKLGITDLEHLATHHPDKPEYHNLDEEDKEFLRNYYKPDYELLKSPNVWKPEE